MRALIVGIGAVGTRAARQLVDTPGVSEVWLADLEAGRIASVWNAPCGARGKVTVTLSRVRGFCAADAI